jgi:hypothetical protein
LGFLPWDLLSLWVHFAAVSGRRVAPAAFFWILHIGILVVWFPAVMVAQRQAGNLKRKDFWKVVLKGSPDWVRYLVYGFLAYAVVKFMICFQTPSGHDDGANPPAMVWLWSGGDSPGIGWFFILRRSPFYIQRLAQTLKRCDV